MVKKFTDADLQNDQIGGQNSYVIALNINSKNETYEFTGNADDVGFVINAQVEGDDNYRSFTTHGKNYEDLVVTTLFYDKEKNAPKVVTTTIKKFFSCGKYKRAYTPQYDTNATGPQLLLTYPNESDIGVYVEDANEDLILASTDKDSELDLSFSGDHTVYDTKGNDSYLLGYDTFNGDYDAIYDFDGDDTYEASDYNISFIRDMKGKDKYNLSGGDEDKYTALDVQDFDGNDEYNVRDEAYLVSSDFKGNDEYNVSDYESYLISEDFKGDDKYRAENGGYLKAIDYKGKDIYDASEGGNINVQDGEGNDKYIKDNSNFGDFDSGYVYTQDLKGNDEYVLVGNDQKNRNINSFVRLTDFEGNDKYTLNRVKPTTQTYFEGQNAIFDGKGNDSYDITNSHGFWIDDEEGNDKYRLSNMLDLNPLSWQSAFAIDDGAGNDTYEVKNVQYDLEELEYGNIREAKGDDKYTLDSTKNFVVVDEEGKDSYTITNSLGVDVSGFQKDDKGQPYPSYEPEYNQGAYIKDLTGDDKYTVVGDSDFTVEGVNIRDDKGKDTYKIADAQRVQIIDYGEYDDKYDILSVSKESYDVLVMDFGGKETYNAKGSYNKKTDTTNWVELAVIDDRGSANDTYNFQYVKGASAESLSAALDKGGDDKYNFTNVQNVLCDDEGQGNDKYSIGGIFTSDVKLMDEGGKDTYTVKGTKNNAVREVSIFDEGTRTFEDSDTYNLEWVSNQNDMEHFAVRIEDNGGNNTFNIKNSIGVELDTLGKDEDSHSTNKYNFTTCEHFRVSDGTFGTIEQDVNDNNGSNGIYTIKSSSGTIRDNYGADTYNISKLSAEMGAVQIDDVQGDDKYSIDKLKGAVYIHDTQGDDTLTIGASDKDLVVMTNILGSDNGSNEDGVLLIYDKKNKGFVNVGEFYEVDENKDYTDRNESIDNVMAGKKKLDGDIFDEARADYNTCRQYVAAWLVSDEQGYASVEDCLMSGNQEDINTLVTAFETHNFAPLQ